MIDAKELDSLNKQFDNSTPEEILTYFLKKNHKIIFASSLGAEDQVITEMIAAIDTSTKMFTLDTGRLFPETYSLLERTNNKYKVNIEIFFPDHNEVENMVREKGINLFYDSVENRKLCCSIRKTHPLKRALKNNDAWICGLRREQSVTRQEVRAVEWDANNNLLKINPLINWTEKQVWDYIKTNHIPYNKLHDKNFPSIGCQPCTRAIEQGEDVRSGRWWWENPEHKECGLHRR